MDDWHKIRGKLVLNTKKADDNVEIDKYILFKVNSMLDRFTDKYKIKDNPYAKWKIKNSRKFD